MVNEIQEAGSAKATFFELLGGEVDGAIKIRALVEAFYDVMTPILKRHRYVP